MLKSLNHLTSTHQAYYDVLTTTCNDTPPHIRSTTHQPPCSMYHRWPQIHKFTTTHSSFTQPPHIQYMKCSELIMIPHITHAHIYYPHPITHPSPHIRPDFHFLSATHPRKSTTLAPHAIQTTTHPQFSNSYTNSNYFVSRLMVEVSMMIMMVEAQIINIFAERIWMSLLGTSTITIKIFNPHFFFSLLRFYTLL